LIAALTPSNGKPRPAAEAAVRFLLGHGQVPTVAAVAAQLATFERHKAAMAAREQRRKQLLALPPSDAAQAATLVADRWQAHGHGPTWHELGRAMGWPYEAVAATICALATAGWLVVGTEPRSLQPGPQMHYASAQYQGN
jgi:hypothetical protein